jgi:hypothetical protein
MKKILFLLLVSTIAYGFISCKKECVCRYEIKEVYDDDPPPLIENTQAIVIQLGQLSDTDCKNWEGHTSTWRDEEWGLTTYTTYTECYLQ